MAIPHKATTHAPIPCIGLTPHPDWKTSSYSGATAAYLLQVFHVNFWALLAT